jgi:hypothetical protein
MAMGQGAGLVEEYLAERGWSLESFIESMVYERRLFEEAGLPFPGSNYKQVAPIPKEEELPKNKKALVNVN